VKKFRFRLERIQNWRRQLVSGRQREHQDAVRTAAEAEAILARHDEITGGFLDGLGRDLLEGRASAETLAASERARAVLATERLALRARQVEAIVALEASLERLVEARRDVKALETLRASRREAWRREAETELQKQADEMHRSRLHLESAADGNRTVGSARAQAARPGESR
jgi:flagellar export protein FliJ